MAEAHTEDATCTMEEMEEEERGKKKSIICQETYGIYERMIKALERENRYLQEKLSCLLCDKKRNTLCLPCGHVTTCADCANKIWNCLICNKKIRAEVNFFF